MYKIEKTSEIDNLHELDEGISSNTSNLIKSRLWINTNSATSFSNFDTITTEIDENDVNSDDNNEIKDKNVLKRRDSNQSSSSTSSSSISENSSIRGKSPVTTVLNKKSKRRRNLNLIKKDTNSETNNNNNNKNQKQRFEYSNINNNNNNNEEIKLSSDNINNNSNNNSLSNESIDQIDIEFTYNINSEEPLPLQSILEKFKESQLNNNNKTKLIDNKDFLYIPFIKRRYSSGLDILETNKGKYKHLGQRSNSISYKMKNTKINNSTNDMSSKSRQQQQQDMKKRRASNDSDDANVPVPSSTSQFYENRYMDTNDSMYDDTDPRKHYSKKSKVKIRTPSEEYPRSTQTKQHHQNTHRSYSPRYVQNQSTINSLPTTTTQSEIERQRLRKDHSKPVVVTLINRSSEPQRITVINEPLQTSTIHSIPQNIDEQQRAGRKRMHSRSRSPVSRENVVKLRSLRDNVISVINKSLIIESKGWVNPHDLSFDEAPFIENEHVQVNGQIQFMNAVSQRLRAKNRITLPTKRSPSVYFLYDKRKSDIRKYYANALPIRSYTTEDVADIYMPKQLDQMKRKIRSSLRVLLGNEFAPKFHSSRVNSANSNRYPANQAKRSRQHTEMESVERITNPARYYYSVTERTEMRREGTYSKNTVHSKRISYTEQAKKKLEARKRGEVSSTGLNELNSKMQTSVTNVMKATQDLARLSEIRQRLGRSYSLHEVYNARRIDIRSSHPKQGTSTNIDNSFTSEDIDSVYLPWMMENYGRKLAIEALRRRSTMSTTENNTLLATQANKLQKQKEQQKRSSIRKSRHKSPYVSQYYIKDTVPKMKRNDLWVIDKDIRKLTRKTKDAGSGVLSSNVDSDLSITDSDTSSEDNRPVVPEKINKPDRSLRNKIMKTINKSLLSSELSGVDFKMLKLNDRVRKTLRKIEKKALERDLDLDLIRSFSCSHLNDLRKEDMKYINMRITNNSYCTEDIDDLYMPKALETYKLKYAIDRERRGRSEIISSTVTPKSLRDHSPGIDLYRDREQREREPVQVRSPPKSIPNILSPLSPNSAARNVNIFKEIIQEKLHEVDYDMAKQISSKKRTSSNVMEEGENTTGSSEEYEDSLNSSDDLSMNDDDLQLFEQRPSQKRVYPKKPLSPRAKILSTVNRSLLQNPSELVSDFYISNMSYSMKRNVQCVELIAEDLRRRKQSKKNLRRSLSVDHLYDVRREHIRYSNGAENQLHKTSFTTDDIQDIYMPWAIDNYKRKIAIELERRRRFSENRLAFIDSPEHAFSSIFIDNQSPSRVLQQTLTPIVIDKFDRLLLKQAKVNIAESVFQGNLPVKASQPSIILSGFPGKNNLIKKTPVHVYSDQSRSDVEMEQEREEQEREELEREEQIRVEKAHYKYVETPLTDESKYVVTKYPPSLHKAKPVTKDVREVFSEHEEEDEETYNSVSQSHYLKQQNKQQPRRSVINVVNATQTIENQDTQFDSIVKITHPPQVSSRPPLVTDDVTVSQEDEETMIRERQYEIENVYKSTAKIDLKNRVEPELADQVVTVDKAKIRKESQTLIKAIASKPLLLVQPNEYEESSLYIVAKPIPPEQDDIKRHAVVSSVTSTLKTVESGKVKTLNAPKADVTKPIVEETKPFIAPQLKPAYGEIVIDEYVRKPFTTSQIQTYESTTTFKPKEPPKVQAKSETHEDLPLRKHLTQSVEKLASAEIAKEQDKSEKAGVFEDKRSALFTSVLIEPIRPLQTANNEYAEIMETVDSIPKTTITQHQVTERTEIPKSLQAVEEKITEIFENVDRLEEYQPPKQESVTAILVKEKKPKRLETKKKELLTDKPLDDVDFEKEDVNENKQIRKPSTKIAQKGTKDAFFSNVDPNFEEFFGKEDVKKPDKAVQIRNYQENIIEGVIENSENIRTEIPETEQASVGINKLDLQKPANESLVFKLNAPYENIVEHSQAKEFIPPAQNVEYELANTTISKLDLQNSIPHTVTTINAPSTSLIESQISNEFQSRPYDVEKANLNVNKVPINETYELNEVVELNAPSEDDLEKYITPGRFDSNQPIIQEITEEIHRIEGLQTITMITTAQSLQSALQAETEEFVTIAQPNKVSVISPTEEIPIHIPANQQIKEKLETTKEFSITLTKPESIVSKEEVSSLQTADTNLLIKINAPQFEYEENSEGDFVEFEDANQFYTTPTQKTEELYEIGRAKISKANDLFAPTYTESEEFEEKLIPLKLSNPEQINLRETKQQNEFANSFSLDSSEVFSLASIREDKYGEEFGHPFYVTQTDKVTANQKEESHILQLQVDSVSAAILNLPESHSMEELNDRAKDFQTPKQPEYTASEKSHELLISLKPSTLEIVALSVPKTQRTEYEDEEVEELEYRQHQQVLHSAQEVEEEREIHIATKGDSQLISVGKIEAFKVPEETADSFVLEDTEPVKLTPKIIEKEKPMKQSTILSPRRPQSSSKIVRSDEVYEETRDFITKVDIQIADVNKEKEDLETEKPTSNLIQSLLIGTIHSETNKPEKTSDWFPINRETFTAEVHRAVPVLPDEYYETASAQELNMATVNYEKNEDLKAQSFLVDEPETEIAHQDKEFNDLSKPKKQDRQSLLSMSSIGVSEKMDETVKPMETIYMDFEESINISSQEKLQLQTQSELEVESVESMYRAEQNREITVIEKCDEFSEDDLFGIKSTASIGTEKFHPQVSVDTTPLKLATGILKLVDFKEDKVKELDIEKPNINEEIQLKNQVNELKNSIAQRASLVLSMAKLITDESWKAEETIELETDQLEYSQLEKSKYEPEEQPIIRVRPSEVLALNKPIENEVTMEKTERFQPEELEYERPKYAMETSSLARDDEKMIEVAESLFAHQIRTEDVPDEKLDAIPKQELNTQVAKVDTAKSELKLEVGIDIVKPLNLASFEKEDEFYFNVKEIRDLDYVEDRVSELLNVAPYLNLPHEELCSQKTIELCLAKEILEFNNTDESCEECDINLEDIQQTSAVKLESKFGDMFTRAQIIQNFIQNTGIQNEIELEKTERFVDQEPDYTKTIELREETKANLTLNPIMSLDILNLAIENDVELEKVEFIKMVVIPDKETAVLNKEIEILDRIEEVSQPVPLFTATYNVCQDMDEQVKEYEEDELTETAGLKKELRGDTETAQKSSVKILNAPVISEFVEPQTETIYVLAEKDDDRDSASLLSEDKVIEKAEIRKPTRRLSLGSEIFQNLFTENLNAFGGDELEMLQEKAAITRENTMKLETASSFLPILLNYAKYPYDQHDVLETQNFQDDYETITQSMNLKKQINEFESKLNDLRIQQAIQLFTYQLMTLDEVKDETVHPFQADELNENHATFSKQDFIKLKEQPRVDLPPLKLVKADIHSENMNEEITNPYYEDEDIRLETNAIVNKSYSDDLTNNQVFIQNCLKLQRAIQNIEQDIFNQETKLFRTTLPDEEYLQQLFENNLQSFNKPLVSEIPIKLVKAAQVEEKIFDQQLNALRNLEYEESKAEMNVTQMWKLANVEPKVVNILNAPLFDSLQWNESKDFVHEQFTPETVSPVKVNDYTTETITRIVTVTALIQAKIDRLIEENEYEALDFVRANNLTSQMPTYNLELLKEVFEKVLINKPQLSLQAPIQDMERYIEEKCSELMPIDPKDEAHLNRNLASIYSLCSQTEHIKWEDVDKEILNSRNLSISGKCTIEPKVPFSLPSQQDSVSSYNTCDLKISDHVQNIVRQAQILFAEDILKDENNLIKVVTPNTMQPKVQSTAQTLAYKVITTTTTTTTTNNYEATSSIIDTQHRATQNSSSLNTAQRVNESSSGLNSTLFKYSNIGTLDLYDSFLSNTKRSSANTTTSSSSTSTLIDSPKLESETIEILTEIKHEKSDLHTTREVNVLTTANEDRIDEAFTEEHQYIKEQRIPIKVENQELVWHMTDKLPTVDINSTVIHTRVPEQETEDIESNYVETVSILENTKPFSGTVSPTHDWANERWEEVVSYKTVHDVQEHSEYDYEVHELYSNERADEIKGFDSDLKIYTKPVKGADLMETVRPLFGINDFDENIEITDAVVEHVNDEASETRSVSSDEVTIERWTEETKVIKTAVYKGEELVEEIVQQSKPTVIVQEEIEDNEYDRQEDTENDESESISKPVSGKIDQDFFEYNKYLDNASPIASYANVFTNPNLTYTASTNINTLNDDNINEFDNNDLRNEDFESLQKYYSDEETNKYASTASDVTTKSKSRLKSRLESLKYLDYEEPFVTSYASVVNNQFDNGDAQVIQIASDTENVSTIEDTDETYKRATVQIQTGESGVKPTEKIDNIQQYYTNIMNNQMDSPRTSYNEFVDDNESGYRSDATRFSLKSTTTLDATFAATLINTKSSGFDEIVYEEDKTSEQKQDENELLQNYTQNKFGSRIKEIQAKLSQEKEKPESTATKQPVNKLVKPDVFETKATDEAQSEKYRKSESETSESQESIEQYKRPSKSEIKTAQFDRIEVAEPETIKADTQKKGLVKDFIMKFEKGETEKSSTAKTSDVRSSGSFEQYLFEFSKQQTPTEPPPPPVKRTAGDRVKEIIEGLYFRSNEAEDFHRTREMIEDLSGEEVQRLKNNKVFIEQLKNVMDPSKSSTSKISEQPERERPTKSENFAELRNALLQKLFKPAEISVTVQPQEEEEEEELGTFDQNITESTLTATFRYEQLQRPFSTAQSSIQTPYKQPLQVVQMESYKVPSDVTDVSDDEQDLVFTKDQIYSPSQTKKSESAETTIQQQPQAITPTKRQLSQIKPETKTYTMDTKEDSDFADLKIQKIVRGDRTETESDTDTSTSILRRNLEILKKKTSERQQYRHQYSSIMTEEALDFEQSFNEPKPIYPDVSTIQKQMHPPISHTPSTVVVQPPPNYVSSHSMKNVAQPKPFQQPLTKLKVIKKLTSDEASISDEDQSSQIGVIKSQEQPQPQPYRSTQQARGRSVSPSSLRIPNILETIETTTQMSYIMSKTVDLRFEERQYPPPSSKSFSIPLVVSSEPSSTDRRSHSKPTGGVSPTGISIPINMQTRSKSESKVQPNLSENRRRAQIWNENEQFNTQENYYENLNSERFKQQRLHHMEPEQGRSPVSATVKVSPLMQHKIYQRSNTSTAQKYAERYDSSDYANYYAYNNNQNMYEQDLNNVRPRSSHVTSSHSSPLSEELYRPYSAAPGLSTGYSGSDSGLATSFSTNHGGKHYEVKTSSPRSRVSFHKFDSNEIIAVVKVPPQEDAYQERQSRNISMSYPNLQSQHLQSNIHTSEPSVGKKITSPRKQVQYKLDTEQQDKWRQWPEYAVDQETDSSIMSTKEADEQPTWIRSTDSANIPREPYPQTIYTPRLSEQSGSGSNVEFEIEVQKRPPNRRGIPQTTVSIDGQPTKAKISTSKDGRVAIQNIAAIPGNEIVIQSDVHQDGAATRMSSGYFSGEEFHNGKLIPRGAMRRNYDQINQINQMNNNNNNNNRNADFDIYKFINTNNNNNYKREKDAIDELDNLYKSLGLEDEALLDRANARDYKLYGQLKVPQNQDYSQSYGQQQQSQQQQQNYENQQQYYSSQNFQPSTTINGAPYQKKSIFSRKSAMPDTVNDDMAKRKHNTNYQSIQNDVFANDSYLSKSPQINEYYVQRNYSNSDDPSILNRKRSSSLSNVSLTQDTLPNNMLILPSPTTADYLRNRTRESALQNAVITQSPDVELSQILYDDMAYRQLRKDSDAAKLSLKTLQQSGNYASTSDLRSTSHRSHSLSSNAQFSNQQQPQQQQQQQPDYIYTNTNNNNIRNNNNNSVKTVKMVKQKDASKTIKRDQNSLSSSVISQTYSSNNYYENQYENEMIQQQTNEMYQQQQQQQYQTNNGNYIHFQSDVC